MFQKRPRCFIETRTPSNAVARSADRRNCRKFHDYTHHCVHISVNPSPPCGFCVLLCLLAKRSHQRRLSGVALRPRRCARPRQRCCHFLWRACRRFGRVVRRLAIFVSWSTVEQLIAFNGQRVARISRGQVRPLWLNLRRSSTGRFCVRGVFRRRFQCLRRIVG